MVERTAIKLLAIALTSMISLVGTFWPYNDGRPDPVPQRIETRATIAPNASRSTPRPTTTLPATTTTLAPPSAPRDPVKEIPADPAKRCPKLEPLFRQYGLLPVEVFSYIAWRESGCRPKAVNARWDEAGNVIWTLNKNGSIDRGLLQINSSWQTLTAEVCGSTPGDMDVLYDLDCNLRVARRLLGDGSGLSNWGF